MFCAHCGKQFQPDANFCSACGTAAHVLPGYVRASRIVRPRHPRVIAGVCSGLAIHFGWDITLIRVLTLVLTFLTGGTLVLLYLLAWIVLPDALYALPQQAVMQPVPMQPQQRPHGTAI